KPLKRTEHPDQIYKDEKTKFAAVAKEIKQLHDQGRPILIGTTSIEKSEYLSDLLKRNGVSHQVLNAKHHEKEAAIIAQAGRLGAVTVATNMAGRGVDIILGGNPPDYKPFQDVQDYYLDKLENFIRDGTNFLESEIGHTEWIEQHQQELRQKSEEVKQCERELKQKLEEYYEESERLTEETSEKLRQKSEEVDELRKALTRGIEEYYEKYESWAEETGEKLKRKTEESKRHEGLLQKVKDIIRLRTGENKQEITQRIKETVQDYENKIKAWRENHKKVVELAGLHIVGTEHHEARRIDNQLRGRAGRQGDPGGSRFYASLEDEIVRRFGGDRVKGLMQWAGMGEDTPIEHPIVNKAMTNAQVQTEGHNFSIRKHLVEYDDVINKHREVIYAERRKILSGADLKANITSMVQDEIQSLVARHLSSPHLSS
ncbi:MAG: preprotein translocase subunit SecA, partial [Dehalococcoidia bacterium]|nr:preprotein translocase subunit SecA [Dehalococcoidia bacterium]